jgi:thioredoxin reductase (NADPH)
MKDSSGAASRDKGVFDCAILGGGPAGLSAALYLGRLKRRVVVIDDHEGRSTWHQVNRNYLGFPDGIHATKLRELGGEQARRYGAEMVAARATDVAMTGEGRERRFTLSTTRGDFTARSLIFATGVTDRFPEFEGSEECIGKSMFWCIICDGYEAQGKRVVVLGHNDRAASLALQLLVFTDKVTMVTGEEELDVEPQRRAALREHGIEVHECGCQVYKCGREGHLASIGLGDGTEIELDMLFVAQWIEPNTELANKLNVNRDEHGYIRNDSEQCTNVDGVYAAGDVTKLYNHQVTSAVHEGGMAAAAVNYYLYEDWQKE